MPRHAPHLRIPRIPRPACAPRHGLTLIETVVAVALLAALSSIVVVGVSMVMGQQVRQQQRLAAAEIANRLILQYLDDPDTMPNPAADIAYGNERYRWELVEAPVQLISARGDVAAELEERSRLTLDRLNAMTVRVWLGEQTGGSLRYEPASPSFTITRVIDPVANVTRNPDSLSNALSSPEKRARIVGVFGGTERGGVLKGGPRATNPAGAPKAPPRATPGGTSPGTTGGDSTRPK